MNDTDIIILLLLGIIFPPLFIAYALMFLALFVVFLFS